MTEDYDFSWHSSEHANLADAKERMEKLDKLTEAQRKQLEECLDDIQQLRWDGEWRDDE